MICDFKALIYWYSQNITTFYPPYWISSIQPRVGVWELNVPMEWANGIFKSCEMFSLQISTFPSFPRKNPQNTVFTVLYPDHLRPFYHLPFIYYYLEFYNLKTLFGHRRPWQKSRPLRLQRYFHKILYMNRSSLRTRRFRRMHFSRFLDAA